MSIHGFENMHPARIRQNSGINTIRETRDLVNRNMVDIKEMEMNEDFEGLREIIQLREYYDKEHTFYIYKSTVWIYGGFNVSGILETVWTSEGTEYKKIKVKYHNLMKEFAGYPERIIIFNKEEDEVFPSYQEFIEGYQLDKEYYFLKEDDFYKVNVPKLRIGG